MKITAGTTQPIQEGETRHFIGNDDRQFRGVVVQQHVEATGLPGKEKVYGIAIGFVNRNWTAGDFKDWFSAGYFLHN